MPNHYRISKTVDGTKTYQLWDNDRVVSEFDSELNMKINYRIGTNGQVLSDSKENSYSYDGHGNLVNAKSSYSTCVYDAYGNKTEDFGTSQNLLFCFHTHHKHKLNSYFWHLQDFHVRHSYMNSLCYQIILDHLYQFYSLFSYLIHYQIQIQPYHYPTTDMFLCHLQF